MKSTFFIFAFSLALSLTAQGNYEQGMTLGLQLWQEGKNKEASAMFERIASAEKDTWLPNYYVALINTISAFETKDHKDLEGLLTKAQTALDVELLKNPENAELLVVQAMIHTARIAYDPRTFGQSLSGKVAQIYKQAALLSPLNPRVILNQAQFEMGTARFFGNDLQPFCQQVEKSIGLFDNFEPETPFHPTWGKKQAMRVLQSCGKQ